MLSLWRKYWILWKRGKIMNKDVTKISVAASSGKGGTGKTFIATNLARVLSEKRNQIRYLDCDVEEPNGHLFLKPLIDKEEDVALIAPAEADKEGDNEGEDYKIL